MQEYFYIIRKNKNPHNNAEQIVVVFIKYSRKFKKKKAKKALNGHSRLKTFRVLLQCLIEKQNHWWELSTHCREGETFEAIKDESLDVKKKEESWYKGRLKLLLWNDLNFEKSPKRGREQTGKFKT